MQPLTLLFFCLLLASCATSPTLDRQQAFKLLQQQMNYPEVLDYDLYCSDPEQARHALDAGLEGAGLLTIQRTQKLSELGQPLIHFTPKATPYLLPTPAAQRKYDIQKVKLAEIYLVSVTGIQLEEGGRHAMIEYTTAYRNLTPFKPLSPIDFKKQHTQKVPAALYDDGWRLEIKTP